MTIDVAALFERYEWSYEAVDDEIWRASFATDRDEDFDLYVASSDDWLHFAVTPFTPLPTPQCESQLYTALLQLNQQMRLARLAVDEDGDVNLLLDLPLVAVTEDTFAIAMDTIVYYTQELSRELARTATEVGYHSPLF